MRELYSLLLLAGVFATSPPLVAQSSDSTPKPYATLDRNAVTYRGPVGAPEKDFPGGVAVIGAILPLQGPQQAEGKALLAAAQVALEEEQARGTLPDGRKLALVARDESGPWGQASTEVLKLIEQDHALVVLTSADGSIAHQAEQIANKISFPILTLASDPATTATNVPWVFRLGPSDADQAQAFCRHIYVELGLKKVLLVAQKDHDGRAGSGEFEKAAKELKARVPERLEISTSGTDVALVGEAIRAYEPEAIVVWTDAAVAKEVAAVARKAMPATPLFLCTKAAQLGAASPTRVISAADTSAKQNPSEMFMVVSLAVREKAARSEFEQHYQTRTGSAPGIAALQVYEAVHLIAAGLHTVGASRVLLRDYFASTGKLTDTAGIVSFDPAGNRQGEFALVKLASVAVSPRGQ